MKNSFKEFLKNNDVVVLDGGMSTALEQKGLTMANPVWNAIGLVATPQLVKEAHRDFFDAGANIVITNTYFCSSWSFRDLNFSPSQTRDYLRLAVQLAKEGRDESKGDQEKFIAGGISCYGVHYSNLSEYTGDYDVPREEYEKYHREKMDVFSEEGVDLLAIETIPNFEESKVILELLKDYPNLVAYFSSTLSDGEHLGDGTPYSELQPLLEEHEQILAYGTNCVKPELADEFLNYAAEKATKPLVVYPNGFGAYDPVEKEFTGDIVDFGDLFTEKVEEWKSLNAKIIGGCCGCSYKPTAVLSDLVYSMK